MNKILFTLLALVLSLTSAGAQSDVYDGLIHFNQGWCKETWLKTPIEQRKKVSHFLLDKLGLSSTGKIELVEVYSESKENQQMFHFQQEDLHGNRLFWSVLVLPDTMKARVIYHVDEKNITTGWINLE